MAIDYCSNCGTRLETRLIDEVERRACPACSFVHWGSYSIGVGGLLVKDGKILLVRRAQNPGMGYWTNPGGYIEQHELMHHTIEREMLEEAGVVAKALNVVAVRDQPRDVHNVYVAFLMEYIEGEPTPDGREVDGAGFFEPGELAEMNVAPFTRWLIDIALNGQSEGLAIDHTPIVTLPSYGLYKIPTR